jgi:hypothetical protein
VIRYDVCLYSDHGIYGGDPFLYRLEKYGNDKGPSEKEDRQDMGICDDRHDHRSHDPQNIQN